ncbi:MAG: DUF1059 domain-containing protein [Gemmatimonadetes bacterium]|nr:DUF1059 domain-containing protein [Gemmatimonadota bacterium]
MKSMTCRDLGGACDLAFEAETFEEMKELSKKHGMEMFAKGDEAHLAAAAAVKDMMTGPQAFREWLASKQKHFDSLPDL